MLLAYDIPFLLLYMKLGKIMGRNYQLYRRSIAQNSFNTEHSLS